MTKKSMKVSRKPSFIYRFEGFNPNLETETTQYSATRAEARSKRNRLLSRGFLCERIERFRVRKNSDSNRSWK